MINVDFADLAPYRNDGRKSSELRHTQAQLGVDSSVEGSCRLKQGLTEVLCLVRGPYQRGNPADNLLKIEYTVAPFSSLERRRGKYDKQFTEFAENVRRSFEGVIPQETYSKNQIEVVVSVIQNEGSAKSAVVNCVALALANAGVAMRDLVISCTVGTINGNLLIDPNQDEQHEIGNELVISYLNGLKQIDCLQLRKAKVREEQLKNIYKVAVQGCEQLYQRLRKVLIDFSYKKMLIF